MNRYMIWILTANAWDKINFVCAGHEGVIREGLEGFMSSPGKLINRLRLTLEGRKLESLNIRQWKWAPAR